MSNEELAKKLQELTLKVQELEGKLEKLEKGEFGTGVYLAGCSEADAAYIAAPEISKKEGV